MERRNIFITIGNVALRMSQPHDALTSLPSFSFPTILSAERVVAYWWSHDDTTSLRIHDPQTDTTDIVHLDHEDFTPDGGEPLHWTGKQLLIQGDPSIYRCDRDGTLEELSLGDDVYTYLIDTDADARRLLYTQYGDPWTLRLYDRDVDTTTVLTECPEQGGHAGFSPDGQWLTYRENPTQTFGNGQIVIAHPTGETETTVQIGDASTRTRLRDWHPDSQRLLLDDRSTGWYRVGLHDWRAGETTWFGTGDHNEYPLTVLPGGDRLVTTQWDNGRSSAVVYSIDASDTERVLDLPAGVVDRRVRQESGVALASDTVLLQHESGTRPPRLLNYNLATDEVEILVDTMTAALDEIDLVEPEYVTYDSIDGTAIDAVLHRAPETPSPAVVNIHGGPTTAVSRDFDPFAHVLVNEGYTVLTPNYRGSTNRDRAFEQAIRGDVGGGEVDDVAAGGRWLAAQPWIDAEQLAAFGHSHGAYNAGMLAVRFSERWQVVIIENGYLEFSAEDANPYSQRRLITDPDQERSDDITRQRSVPRRADEITCPLCLIYGERDNVDGAQDLVDALDQQGWTEGDDYHFAVIEDEGHVIQDTKRLWHLVVETLEEYS
jgi:dipeptidyl aminopeptidase/acylaminoacyl peptidase